MRQTSLHRPHHLRSTERWGRRGFLRSTGVSAGVPGYSRSLRWPHREWSALSDSSDRARWWSHRRTHLRIGCCCEDRPRESDRRSDRCHQPRRRYVPRLGQSLHPKPTRSRFAPCWCLGTRRREGGGTVPDIRREHQGTRSAIALSG